jgi:hypothetical protein
MSTLAARGNVARIFAMTASINVGSVAINTVAEQTFTIPGLLPGDFVILQKPSLSAGLGVLTARVSAANTLAVQFVNATGGAIDPAAETYQLLVIRPEMSQAQIPAAFVP